MGTPLLQCSSNFLDQISHFVAVKATSFLRLHGFTSQPFSELWNPRDLIHYSDWSAVSCPDPTHCVSYASSGPAPLLTSSQLKTCYGVSNYLAQQYTILRS